MDDRPSSMSPGSSPNDATPPDERSIELVRRARRGDPAALEALLQRYLPRLRRWATGRLPVWARGEVDTDDMVQEALIRTCDNLDAFEMRGEGALQAYLRQALRNRITDEVRRAMRGPQRKDLPVDHPAALASPLEEAVGIEAADAYERGLAALADGEREAVIARVEMGLSYQEIAAAMGKPSADAARMTVTRALVRLAEVMGHGRD